MPESHNPSSKPRVLSGMRPTGKFHLGNYVGALANWVKLQDSARYECYYFIADWHALTTDYADPSRIKISTLDMVLDWLAAGLDPEKSTIFLQSQVLQHAELHLLFSMITPLGWLERVPTYKEQQENITGKDLTTYGFLGYPLLQSADILVYQADFVPVGQDQVAHVELTREVARRFNSTYRTNVFPEPAALLTEIPKLLGTDGRKMSKSYGNTIGLSEAPQSVALKIRNMSTGGQRVRQTDAGNPDLCPVGDLHKIFSAPEIVAETRKGCMSATIRCETCKMEAEKSVCAIIGPFHEKRRKLESEIDSTWEMLRAQSAKAATRAEETMVKVREVIGISRELGETKSLFEHSDGEVLGESSATHLLNFGHVWPFNQAWENAARAEQKKEVRIAWVQRVKRDALLTTDLSKRFESVERELEEPVITQKGKRVFIDSDWIRATRDNVAAIANHEWNFAIPSKTFEIWVLLTGIYDPEPLMVQDFVLPQKVFSQSFAAARKHLGKNEKVPVSLKHVEQEGAHCFMLSVPGNDPMDVTAWLGNYEPLQ